jgi:hypothetical protein
LLAIRITAGALTASAAAQILVIGSHGSAGQTAPPLRDPTYAANARAFNNWLVSEWLANYTYSNVFVFDFYNVLTTNGDDASGML